MFPTGLIVLTRSALSDGAFTRDERPVFVGSVIVCKAQTQRREVKDVFLVLHAKYFPGTHAICSRAERLLQHGLFLLLDLSAVLYTLVKLVIGVDHATTFETGFAGGHARDGSFLRLVVEEDFLCRRQILVVIHDSRLDAGFGTVAAGCGPIWASIVTCEVTERA